MTRYLLLFFYIPSCFPAFSAISAPQSPFIKQLIASAEAKIKASPQIAGGYSDLAFALARRARESEDAADRQRALDAVTTALTLNPGDFEARKARVMVRLLEGRYADAEEEAQALNKQTPDDNLIYGLLADAALETGKYAKAEIETQRMLDLRQVNGPGLQRAARLREAIGFPDGAAEFWNSAFRLASTTDAEERAYVLTQLAGLNRRRAKLSEAERLLTEALALEPDYPAALRERARVDLDAKKPNTAIATLNTRLAQQPNDEAALCLYVSALELQGKAAEAKTAAASYLQVARSESAALENRPCLIRYMTSHNEPGEAVRIAKETENSSATVDFYDAYAMALLANNDAAQAKLEMEHALAPGIQNPQYFLNAAKVALTNKDTTAARVFLKKVLEANATSELADQALEQLQHLPVH